MEDITTSNNIHTLSTEPLKECFCTDDGWSHVFTFLGKGHYLLLALVSKRFAKLYAKVYPRITYGDISGYSLSLAKFCSEEWKERLPFFQEGMHNNYSYRTDKEFPLSYIELCAAKCGTIETLEWIYELKGENRLEPYRSIRTLEPSHRIPRLRGGARTPSKKGTASPIFPYTIGEAAAEANQIQVLKFLLEKYRLIENKLQFFYKFIKTAAGKGHLQCVMFLCENECSVDESERIYDCQSAARHGQLECLKYLKDQGWPVDATVILEAAAAGHLHCIQYLRSVGCPWNAIDVGEDEFEVDDSHEDHITEACAESSLECLIYCHDNGCNIDFNLSCAAAVKNGKIDCIQYLRSKGCPWSDDFPKVAAEHDQLDCLQYLHKNGCPWNEDACEKAVHRDTSRCLQYLHENGCPWNEDACAKAVHRDASRCLQYLHENGCRWQPTVLILEALRCGKLDCLKYVLGVGTALPHDYESILIQGDTFWARLQRMMRGTSRSRIPATHMDCLGYCLQYLKETGQDNSRDLMLKAIRHGLVQTLQYLSSEEMKNDTTIAGYAANHGQVECLTYLHENGFRWDENSYAGYLRENGADLTSHLRCLRYMKEHHLGTNQNALLHTIRGGYVQFIDPLIIKDEWKSDDAFCMMAIHNRFLTCFELLIERGFAFDSKLCAMEAAKVGNIACLEFLHINGFPIPKEALDVAESHGREDCVEYIEQHCQCQCHNETTRKRSANDANLDNL